MRVIGVATILAAVVSGCRSGASETNGQPGVRDSSASAADVSVAGTAENTLATRSGGDSASIAGVAGVSGRDLPRVVMLGTSLTAGLGLQPDQAYPALLQRKADSAGYRVSIVNAGLSGETTAGALRRAEWVLRQPAVLVVLEVGANDGLRGVDPDSVRGNIVRLVSLVRKTRPEARIALVQMEAPTNLGAGYTTRFRTAYVQAAKEAGVDLWPFLLDGVAGIPELNQPDGIHPNERGEEIVAATMWRSLSGVLAALKLR